MAYSHKMTPLPQQYDQAAVEKKWQKHWLAARTYAWNPQPPREDSYVIDTPPPTVSGTLHMGHVFSYTQADFIARFQRMTGKNVFYPMGFDDNGLPTERLVEKTKKIRAVDMSREKFIEECLGVSEEARKEFRALFESIALSVDWDQEYHTISDDSRRLSQLSFLDLVKNEHCYRAQRPFYWDPVDQTAIASAEIEDKELPSFANDIIFKVVDSDAANSGRHPVEKRDLKPQGNAQDMALDPGLRRDDSLVIMTTRPELLPACVALFCHPDDTRYLDLHGKEATVPLFGFPVPILTDVTVDMDKGTGLMMCCTFGDDADIAKWQKHSLPVRVVINKFGKIDLAAALAEGRYPQNFHWPAELAEKLQGKKISNTDQKHPGARQIIIEELRKAGVLIASKPITHTVKCAERSGAPLEILPTHQWFVKVTDKKEELKKKARDCVWNPDWMRLRIEQWIDGLNQDWCISRQRYFGVPFPVWYGHKLTEEKNLFGLMFFASPSQLPVNPIVDVPNGFEKVDWDNSAIEEHYKKIGWEKAKADNYTQIVVKKKDTGELYLLLPDPDVMDTWATSSISPQLSAGAISPTVIPGLSRDPAAPHAQTSSKPEGQIPAQGRDDSLSRFQKLFPADLRPQAHEIIRTWAFYTIVKAHLHNNSVPWHNLMISGWCLAEDKSKMSKSKGNVITPVALIEERGTDAVRYWAGTSRLGADTAFSPDLLKIGKKLVGKLWNATQFASIHLAKMAEQPTNPSVDSATTETLDRWILSRLGETVAIATEAFRTYEYADALDATNQFFWADFCDNYLELIKKRVYNEPVTPSHDGVSGSLAQAAGDPGIRRDDAPFPQAAQQSAVRTLYYVLDGILKLYAPFVPHVTEELYAHIFAEAYAAKGSLHAQGQWPLSAHYFIDREALAAGAEALATLTAIRNAKSTSNVSIKFPVKRLVVSSTLTLTDRWIGDVLGAGNVVAWERGAETVVELAEAAEVA